MQHAKDYCHCRTARRPIERSFGSPVPNQAEKVSREDEIRVYSWMANDVAIAFLARSKK